MIQIDPARLARILRDSAPPPPARDPLLTVAIVCAVISVCFLAAWAAT